MDKIPLICKTCGKAYMVYPPDLHPEGYWPEGLQKFYCNWCPDCEDRAQDYYNEWWDDTCFEGYYPPDPNQLKLFSDEDS